jgi:hypothetical protein
MLATLIRDHIATLFSYQMSIKSSRSPQRLPDCIVLWLTDLVHGHADDLQSTGKARITKNMPNTAT